MPKIISNVTATEPAPIARPTFRRATRAADFMLSLSCAIRDYRTRLTLPWLSRRLEDRHTPAVNRELSVTFELTLCRKPLTSVLSPRGRGKADQCEADASAEPRKLPRQHGVATTSANCW